jgi:hypothetical protein
MIVFDGFIDSYYSYDFNHPKNDVSLYTIQAVKHNTPSINLAHLGANYLDPHLSNSMHLEHKKTHTQA